MRQKKLFMIAVLAMLAIPGAAMAFNIDTGSGQGERTLILPALENEMATIRAKPELLAQSAAETAFRVNEMQEQVRRLNGKVEELTFQLLQLQEQIRKMQQDNEFRFQELEEKRSDAGGAVKDRATASSGDNRLGKPQPSEDVSKDSSSGGDMIKRAGRILGSPPRNLGTLRFDAQGNVIESAVGKPLDLTRPTESTVNKLTGDGGADTTNLKPAILLARGRDLYDDGDYVLAEKNLRLFVKAYPENKNRAEVQYWLGRSLFARGEFHAAATVFLDTHNTYPDAKRAPETLLQLGLSMAGLNHREIACATYAEVLKQFPNAGKDVKSQVTVERKSASC